MVYSVSAHEKFPLLHSDYSLPGCLTRNQAVADLSVTVENSVEEKDHLVLDTLLEEEPSRTPEMFGVSHPRWCAVQEAEGLPCKLRLQALVVLLGAVVPAGVVWVTLLVEFLHDLDLVLLLSNHILSRKQFPALQVELVDHEEGGGLSV